MAEGVKGTGKLDGVRADETKTNFRVDANT